MCHTRESVTAIVRDFIERLRRANPDAVPAVILVGSVARNTASAQSDVDLVVVSEERLVRAQGADETHIQSFTRAQFLDRLRAGDDFVAWCVRYGIPVLDAPIWTTILASPEAAVWPSWQAKIPHVVRRLVAANDLRATGDLDAAAEELVYAISHAGRAILLQRNVFPLSRPEMESQLVDVGYPELGKLLQDISKWQPPAGRVDQGIQYVKRIAIHMDKRGYKELVDARRTIAASKKRPA